MKVVVLPRILPLYFVVLDNDSFIVLVPADTVFSNVAQKCLPSDDLSSIM